MLRFVASCFSKGKAAQRIGKLPRINSEKLNKVGVCLYLNRLFTVS